MTLILIFLLFVAIGMQIRTYIIFRNNVEYLDADPFVFGANKYGVDECTCRINNNTEIYFNKTTSLTKITQKSFDFNFDNLK